jgi:predicted ATPase
VLAIVDDLQWLDEASADAILFAARRLGSEGVAILLAARDAPCAPFEASGVERLGLTPLSEARAREVLAAAEGGAALAPTVADRLLATAAGNPLALTEIPGLLDEDQRAGRAPLEEPLPAGTGIARAFARRLEELPDDARAGLLLAAADEGARLDVLLDALQAQGHDAGALERAEVAGVVELERGHVRFRHPLWRSAAYHAATPAQRRAAHETLAGAWPEDAPARAWHRAEATLRPTSRSPPTSRPPPTPPASAAPTPPPRRPSRAPPTSPPPTPTARAACSRPPATPC